MRCFFYVQKMTTKLAFDRSVRTVDVDGRLHVAISRISKATVSPYYGREIPDPEKQLGLNPETVYMLLRDPSELANAASSFNKIQLLRKHVPVSADDHQPDLVVGCTGSDAAFDGIYLTNSLAVWESVAIAGIQSKEQCELSCSYRYTPDMTPGTFDGVAYDGVMRNIIGNHVALVEVGRAGPEVVVGDANPFIKPTEQSPMKKSRISLLTAALIASIGPAMALDASFKPEELAKKLVIALDADPEKDDKEDKKPAFDGDEQGPDESDEDYKKRMDAKKPAADEEDDKEDKNADKAAMDSAIRSAVSAAETATVKRMNAIRQAEREVQPLIGEVVAQDSAEAVYKLALDHAGVDLAGVPAAAFGAMVRMLSKPAEKSPRVAMDAASTTDFAAMFPTAGKVTRS
jgi:hypothetical protein